MTVTIELFPWQGHKDRGGFRVVESGGILSGICWQAHYGALDPQQKWSPKAYELREYDDQTGTLGRVIESFSHKHYLRQHIEDECNAPMPPPAGFTQDMAETYSDNH